MSDNSKADQQFVVVTITLCHGR